MDMLTLMALYYLERSLDTGGVTVKDLVCMTTNIWHEARGEEYFGYLYVAQTVRNRVKQPKFPNTPCKVIYAPGAFEWTEDDHSDRIKAKVTDREKLETIMDISAQVLLGNYDGVISGAVHYYNPAKVTPCWKAAYSGWITEGSHKWGIKPNGKTPCWDSLELAKK